MLLIYPFIISFIIVFVSELGDKTQLLALSFSSKLKTSTILFGVALGSLFSHGIAILFGSFLGNVQNFSFQYFLKLITYFSFIVFGILTLKSSSKKQMSKEKPQKKIYNNLNYILFIAFSIAVGELGDKTFLASIGLGIQYPNYKLLLVLGAIFAMIASDLIAILFGKVLSKKMSESLIQKCSGILFLIFGLFGLIGIFKIM
ncbi:MAG: TMEM165/GDT1 family protein [Clostridia bacterium]|nr:TMEM165/GDT1 family protein [Clostridia bacterium]